jgi:homoserine acetyltransferase
VEYHHIEAALGHDSFLVEVETMTTLVGGYLTRLANDWKVASP